MPNKKILIIHDRFMFRGGAERLVLDMARGLRADIATGFWSEEATFPKSDVPHKLFVLGNPSQKSGWRYVKFQLLFYFRTKFISDYDVVIFSGNNCLSAAHNVRPGARKIFYCHTPVRHAFDLRKYYLSNMPAWKGLIFRLLILGSRLVYKRGFRQMDTVVANSRNVQQRIRKYLKTDSRVVYPPIQTDKFRWQGQKDYYLSFARVDRLKRVGDIVRAFQKMPAKKLIVASSGDDINNVKELAAGYENIQVLGWVNDDELAELVGSCIATIYIPIDEDFGMTQIESLAAGKPVIGVKEGGLAETIEDGVTGRLLSSDYKIEDIAQAVEELPLERASAMRDSCIAAAQKYSVARFSGEMREVINDTNRPIVIGIDANQANQENKSGIHWYAYHLIENLKLVAQRPEFRDVKFRLYSSQPLRGAISRLPDNFEARVLEWLPDSFWNMWTQIRLSFELIANKPDVFLAPGYSLPLLHPKKSVVVIHDLGYMHHPEFYSKFSRLYYKFLSWYSVKSAWRVITPSDFTKRDIIECYGCPPDKVMITPLGFNRDLNKPLEYNNLLAQALYKFEIKRPYLFYIARLSRNKNILGLVKSFHLLKQSGKFEDLQLVVAGSKQLGWEEMEQYIIQNNLEKQVKVLGYVSEADKPVLLAGAEVFVFPSFFEGFGLPVLEAMACGTPVVCSSATSLPEVAGEAAILVDPHKTEDMAAAIERILTDDKLRQGLIKKGLKQAQKFSWEKTAWATLKILLSK